MESNLGKRLVLAGLMVLGLIENGRDCLAGDLKDSLRLIIEQRGSIYFLPANEVIDICNRLLKDTAMLSSDNLVDIYVVRSRCHFIMDNSVRSLEDMEEAYNRRPTDPEIRLRKAIAVGRAGEEGKCVRELHQLKADNPDYPYTYSFLASLSGWQNDIPSTIKYADRAIELAATRRRDSAWIEFIPNTYYTRAIAHLRQQRFEKALGDLERALSMMPYMPDFKIEPYILKAYALNRLGRYSEAAASVGMALRIDSDSEDAQFELWRVYFNTGKYEVGHRFLQKLDKYLPVPASRHLAYGFTSLALGRLEKALEYCERALALKQNFSDAYVLKGDCFYYLRRYSDALEYYEKALTISPENCGALEGQLWIQAACPDKKLRNSKKALDRALDNLNKEGPIEIWRLLAAVGEANSGDFEAAVRRVAKLVEESQQDSEMHMVASKCLKLFQDRKQFELEKRVFLKTLR